MPSDAGPVERVMEGVRIPMEEFQSALVRAVEDVKGFLAAHRAPTGDSTPGAAAQLGAFGAGRIDPSRFASLLVVPETMDAERLHRVELALAHLEALQARGSELYRARVAPDGDLRDTVAGALRRIGGAFGMIRVVASARDERSEPLDPEDFVNGLPLERWGRSERRLAPPLVVEVDGANLAVGGLAEFLDGGLEIVLVVSGAAPPAALAGLITPDVYVAQTPDPADIAPAMAHKGPVVMAIMPDGAARFTHDPTGGSTYSERLRIDQIPDLETLTAMGGRSVFRQRQDLEHLGQLALASTSNVSSRVVSPVEGSQPEGEADATPADRLAGWLIQQARLESVG